jgi:tetratricopeptide (TPR) repeat protein
MEPNNTDVLQNLGNAYSATRELDKAVDAHEKVLQINPDSVDAKSALAGIYGWQGDIDRAKRVFYEIIAEYPSAPEPYRGLSLIHKFSEDDELIPTLENIYNSSSDEQVTMHIGFTLAKAYHDTKSYSSAFGPLLKANAIRAKAEIYDPAKREEILADTKNRYIAARGHVAGSMNSEPQLIFIVGMNRSGTSLIEQIVASHSSVFGGGERSEFVLAAEDTLQLEGPLDQSTVDTLHAEFTETMRGISGSCRYASDKLPMNFQWIGLIKTVFPTAKIINTVRDPRDVCLSNFRNYFSSKGNAYCYTLEHLAHYFGEYRNMMKFWHAEFPGEIFDCCYEDLTENQESVSRNLIKYLELEWEDQVLDFHKTKRDVITASVAQVRQKMYKGSVSGWRAYEEMLQPLIDGLNENGSLPYRRLDWLKDS